MDGTNTSTETTMASTTKTTASVQVWNPIARKTTWRLCTIVGRKPAPRSFVEVGKVEAWYDVVTRDGAEYRMCNPACVRVA